MVFYTETSITPIHFYIENCFETDVNDGIFLLYPIDLIKWHSLS